MLSRYRLAQRLPKFANSQRGLSSAASSGGRTLAVGAAAAIGGGGAVTIAAWKVPGFRKSIEDRIPPIKSLFDPMLGPRQEDLQSPADELFKKPNKDYFEAPMKDSRKRNEGKKDADSHSALDQNNEQKAPTKESNLEGEKPSLESVLLSENPTNATDEIVSTEPPSEVIENKEDIVPEVTAPALDSTSVTSLSTPVLESVEIQNDMLPNTDESISNSPTQKEIENKMIELEEDKEANDAAMSAILDDTLTSCASVCSYAIESNNEAAEAIMLHTSLIKAAMNDADTTQQENTEKWTDISRVLEQKSRLQSEAESSARDARLELAKLERVIVEMKNSDSESVAEKIVKVEETCNQMRKELEEGAKNVNVALSESHVVSEYKDLVDKAKEQFREELMSIVPDVKLESGWRKLSQKLSNDDLNALIAHAHRRVDQLQRELAEERAIAVHRIAAAVKMAREKWEENSAIEIENKINSIKRDAETEHYRKMTEVRRDFENEMRLQLKRQAAAHSDHLSDVLAVQEKEIRQQQSDEFSKKLLEQETRFSDEMSAIKSQYESDVLRISENFQFELNRALAKVAGIETAVDGRAFAENESRKAQELWLACEALRIAVQHGNSGKPAPLRKELQAIGSVPGVESLVRDIVDSFPKEAYDRGVFTEDALRSAYRRVAKVCRRVSLINESRNSFFDYALSYLKSLLIISRAQTEPPADLDVSGLDTFSILNYATYCLERGDLEQAARFVNQLDGEPRRVAEGWLREARLLLETRQGVEVLSCMASATSIAANLEL